MNFKAIFESLFLESKVKATKDKASYIAHSVDGHRCDSCTMWRPPNGCSAVAGIIKPNGWCKWWKKSHRKVIKKNK
jgi:hypothetical protein